MKSPRALLCALVSFCVFISRAQVYDQPDRGSPGDGMIQDYLRVEAQKLETDFLKGINSLADWQKLRPTLAGQFFHMLGLSPLPEKTPLRPNIVRTIDRGDYFVDLLQFQSLPGLYVTANLYRPAKVDGKLPAILYVCGHSGRGRNGNKTAFQSHGIWLARHGYLCLMIDTLQLGEIAGIHHGTYREGRWWWLSRGYTPAGVECWNGVRAIDYLVSRTDVDAERIGVTGISGGGAASFWIAAADERVKVAVPVSGMADLDSYVSNRVVNGHCDCMFLYNTYQWHWTRIAGLIAPRPMLFVNSDQDPIFPMDANERIINRLERLYSLFGASDVVDSFVSIGGHDYRKDIRQGVFRFLNTHLKNDPRPVEDSEVDLVVGAEHPIAPEELRVFSREEDIPADALNGRIDETFVAPAQIEPPLDWLLTSKDSLVRKLRDVTFHHFPERIPPAVEDRAEAKAQWLRTEGNIRVRLQQPEKSSAGNTVYLRIAGQNGTQAKEGEYLLEPRGIGPTAWTTKNPPNYVERAHYLLGRTVDSGRVWDIAAVARYLKAKHPGKRIHVAGEGAAGVLGVYASILEREIDGLFLGPIPLSLMEKKAPVLLNALRVCDVPEAIAISSVTSVEFSGTPLPEKLRRLREARGAPPIIAD